MALIVCPPLGLTDSLTHHIISSIRGSAHPPNTEEVGAAADDSLDRAQQDDGNDLAANPSACTLAYIHHPLYATGSGGVAPEVKPLIKILYNNNADVVPLEAACPYGGR